MPEAVDSTFKTRTFGLTELDQVARGLLGVGFPGVWCFYGDMGSGKTTMIKHICQQLGVTSGMSSPTFSLINEYHGSDHLPVYHFDFYRLKNETEAYDLGTEEYFESGSYCFVEWPEKIPSLIPVRHIRISLAAAGPSTRKIEFEKHE